MKKAISCVCMILVFSILCSIPALAGSHFSYDDKVLADFADNRWEDIKNNASVISLTPGATAGEVRFAWLSGAGDIMPQLKISRSPDMTQPEYIPVTRSATLVGKQLNQAVAKNLRPGDTYYYAYRVKGQWSAPATYTVQNPEDYRVLFVSDAQIGRSGDCTKDEVLMRDTCGWNDTMAKAYAAAPDAAFAISTGDQLERGYSVKQYRCFLSPTALRSLPVAQSVGNHDFYFPLYRYYNNAPNTVKEKLASPAGNGYFYTYGDALFIVMNSNDFYVNDQRALLDAAVTAHPECKWRIAVLHHSVYSACYSDDEFSIARTVFAPLFDAYGIDLALSGHEHVYSRSKPMYNGKEAQPGQGTVYVEASSASGSNFSGIENPSYSAYALQEQVCTYTTLHFSPDALTLETRRTDTNAVIDTAEIADVASPEASATVNLTTWLVHLINGIFAAIK